LDVCHCHLLAVLLVHQELQGHWMHHKNLQMETCLQDAPAPYLSPLDYVHCEHVVDILEQRLTEI